MGAGTWNLVTEVGKGCLEKTGIWGGRIDWPLHPVCLVKLSCPLHTVITKKSILGDVPARFGETESPSGLLGNNGIVGSHSEELFSMLLSWPLELSSGTCQAHRALHSQPRLETNTSSPAGSLFWWNP